MAVRRSKNYWAYKNKQRRRYRVSAAVHETRWGKALIALCICLATFLIVLAMGPPRHKGGNAAHAVAETPPSANQEEMGLGMAMLGDRIQQQLDAVQTAMPEETAPVETASEPPLDKTPDEDVPDVDVPVISRAPKEGATPAVALTFDDGPNNITTPKLLDALKERNLKATFFTLGHTSPGTDKTLQRIIEEGHEVGSHTYNHENLRSLNDEDQYSELNDNQLLIEKYGGNVRYIRPPYGKYDKRVLLYAYQNNCSLIMWDIDPEDYKYKKDPNGAQIIANHILDNVKDGDIILLHDIHEVSVDAAIILLDELPKRGFQLLTVNELINR